MIPDTLPYYLFIRPSIWALRSVAPASAVYCAAVFSGFAAGSPWLTALAVAELLFYLCVSLPRQHALNRSAPSLSPSSREQRLEVFERCWGSVPDPELCLRTWFKLRADLDELRRDEVKDFLAWAFLGKTEAAADDGEELETYVGRLEDLLGRRIPPGRGPHRPSQVSTDALRLQHKPLLFYLLAVGGDDLLTYAAARRMGLEHHRLPLARSLTVFPFRPHTALTRHVSPSRHLSYYHRPHTSRQRLPVLFLHGIGAGMRTYTGFLRDFLRHDDAPDGQTGVLALELMPVSMRITTEMPERDELLAEILAILAHHGWRRFVVMAHSYGTILATHLAHELAGGRVGPLLLVDPVTLCLHWGDVPHNFIYRAPRSASEWQLHYFASTDMGAAHTITRRFDWTHNVLWRDDLRGRTATVVLAGRDIILEPYRLLSYLEDDETGLRPRVCNSRDLPQDGRVLGHEGLGVLFYDHLNHAGMFDRPEDWLPLVEILHKYCRMGGEQ